MAGYNKNNNGEVTFDILEHIGVIDVIDNREEKWTKEINIVAWNGGRPKIDIRDWNADHTRMSRGITLTEMQAKNLAFHLSNRYRDRQGHTAPQDPYDR